jgi:hypothetical protein
MNNKSAIKLSIFNILKEGTTDVELFSSFLNYHF